MVPIQWKRRLVSQAHKARSRHRLRCTRLEDRLAPTGNLQITSALLVDGNGVAEPTPVTGQLVYVQANWNTANLAGGESYVVQFSVDGVAVNSKTITGTAGANVAQSYARGGWYASPG